MKLKKKRRSEYRLEDDLSKRCTMIPCDCKRLIEVDVPIAAVSIHSASEKSIHHGHPLTHHLRWARRPSLTCRAMLNGFLFSNPVDVHCLSQFKEDVLRNYTVIINEPPEWFNGLNHEIFMVNRRVYAK